jgi:pantothenate kinase
MEYLFTIKSFDTATFHYFTYNVKSEEKIKAPQMKTSTGNWTSASMS